MSIQIVVIEAANLLVGEVAVGNSVVTVTNASVIRRWGTTKGLGEIAMGGPTKETILDKLGIAHVQLSKVLFIIDCEQSKWKKL